MCAMNRRADPKPPEVEVVIEIPRGSFIKRGSTGHIDSRATCWMPSSSDRDCPAARERG